MPNETATRELVIAAYRVLLGREPETDAAIDKKVEDFISIDATLRLFVDSQEFKTLQARAGGMAGIAAIYHREARRIDVNVPDDILAKMFARVQAQWAALGETEPHWSVLTNDKFRAANIDKNLDDFYASGRRSAGLINAIFRRTGTEMPSGTCFELGCGVGRVTVPLARMFSHVDAVDVSEGNLRHARARMEVEGIQNCELMILRDPGQLQGVAGYDFFYSMIVLQHNPPPVAAEMLYEALSNLEPGGAFLFQAQTHADGYEFDADAYLASHDPVGAGFEMHALPMPAIMNIIEATDCRVKEVLADNMTGTYGSHTFFGVKRARTGARMKADRARLDNAEISASGRLARATES
jgi:2-polyprenyl-3-methyl-5-hydroxy-6-metoxy-1,4-benzoquinol methylase